LTRGGKIKTFKGEIIAFLHICVFITITAGSAKADKMILSADLQFKNVFGQWIIALFALLFGILCGLLYAWYRYFERLRFQANKKLYLNLLAIEGVSIALGFIFFGAIEVKASVLWTSIVILPLTAATYLLFIGNWKSNDYFFYENGKLPDSVENSSVAKSVAAVEPASNLTLDESGPKNQDEQQKKSIKTRVKTFMKEAFCTELKKVLMCKYRPKDGSAKDKMTFSMLPILTQILSFRCCDCQRLSDHTLRGPYFIRFRSLVGWLYRWHLGRSDRAHYCHFCKVLPDFLSGKNRAYRNIISRDR
jgi:hypothetical protein